MKSKFLTKVLNPSFILRVITIISIAYFIYYLWWRATSTLNPEALIFSWFLLAAEAFGVFTYILFAWMTQDISPQKSHKIPMKGLLVDIFIPTFNEDAEILEATLTGCKKIIYPHTTYILDDGKRQEIEQLAQHLGAHYISRPTHENAKAGNINYALAQTHGEYIVLLDADMVPQSNLLDRTLNYFDEEKLGFIQLPQEFYNQDSIQHDDQKSDWHEQALFFRVIQPGKNHSNSAFWCGSPSVVRRKALEDVGGVATETVTEDIHTSVRMHSHGWTSLFLNEPLAYGIAPQTIKAFLLQRLRWAQGTMQLYRSKDNPLWKPGLTWRQRISYLSSFLAYFESFQKLILISTPIFILIFNVFPMQVSVTSFLLRWIPYFLLNIVANQVGGRGEFRYFKTEKFNILKMIVFIQSTLTLFSQKNLAFKVTPKSIDSTVYNQERKSLRGFMVILSLLIGAMLFGLINILDLKNVQLGIEKLIFAFIWASYNAIVVFSALSEILRKQHERNQYRFPVDLRGRMYDKFHHTNPTTVNITDLSVSGASFFVSNGSSMDLENNYLQIDIPGRRGVLLPVKTIHNQSTDFAGKIRYGVSFVEELGIQRERLFEYLFIDLPRIHHSSRSDVIDGVTILRPIGLSKRLSNRFWHVNPVEADATGD